MRHGKERERERDTVNVAAACQTLLTLPGKKEGRKANAGI
jgi:hypothetical protein